MTALQLTITNAGLAALVDAQNGDTEAIRISQIGLTSAAFTSAPTLTALPGEFKRIATIAGQSISETVIHMTVQDPGTDTYDLRGLALYLDDGTLFAIYGQDDPLFSKVSIATFLLAFDVSFENDVDSAISFGDALFLYPPASETVKGVAELATQAEVDAGDDDLRIITPMKLKVRLLALLASITASIDGVWDGLNTLVARTFTGAGLATGGGSLAASRVITVAAATPADIATGVSTSVAVTPYALAHTDRSMSQTGYRINPGGEIEMWGRVNCPGNVSTAVTFPFAFPVECFIVIGGAEPAGNTDFKDNGPGVTDGSITSSGFSFFNAHDNTLSACWRAWGI